MPIYEYYCEDCNHEIAEIMAHDAIVKCPLCGGLMIKKVSLYSHFTMEPWNV